VVLPPQRRARPLPYTGKVLKEKADSWWHGLSPSSRQDRLESALLTLKSLADAGLGAASVLANLHHRQIVPLMKRELRVYEMSEAANPTLLARSRFHSELLLREYAATRRGGPLASRPSGIATTTSGRSLCFPTPRQ
jgi:hypothetical protein